MIKINKVSRLGSEKKKVLYKDLKIDEAFVYAGEKNLKIKTVSGHLHRSIHGGWAICDIKQPDFEVIPVDAEINWCHRENN